MLISRGRIGLRSWASVVGGQSSGAGYVASGMCLLCFTSRYLSIVHEVSCATEHYLQSHSDVITWKGKFTFIPQTLKSFVFCLRMAALCLGNVKSKWKGWGLILSTSLHGSQTLTVFEFFNYKVQWLRNILKSLSSQILS